MRKLLNLLLLFCSLNVLSQNDTAVLESRIKDIEKENAVLKAKFETYVAESDKKLSLFQSFATALVGLLVVIYGIGFWRAESTSRKTAADEFRKEFDRYDKQFNELKDKGEKIVEDLSSVNNLLSNSDKS
jgi:hypothetical protein